MPTYEYQCIECGFLFEEFQSIMDEPLAVCPSCGGELRRLLSGGAGLIFKGSGFYITDYTRKNSGDSRSPQEASDKKRNPQRSRRKRNSGKQGIE